MKRRSVLLETKTRICPGALPVPSATATKVESGWSLAVKLSVLVPDDPPPGITVTNPLLVVPPKTVALPKTALAAVWTPPRPAMVKLVPVFLARSTPGGLPAPTRRTGVGRKIIAPPLAPAGTAATLRQAGGENSVPLATQR